MTKLLALDEPVTAVFASSDVQAVGAWKAIVDAGKKVPDDYVILGYDNIKASRYIGLTSIDQSMSAIGERATDLLLKRIQGEYTGPPTTVQITPELCIRRSSGM